MINVRIILIIFSLTIFVLFGFSQSELERLSDFRVNNKTYVFANGCIVSEPYYNCIDIEEDSIRGIYLQSFEKFVFFNELQKFKNLELIIIEKNGKSKMVISNDLDQLDKLKQLSFMYAYERVVFEDGIYALDSLKYLYLPDKSIREIPSFVYQSKNLLYLSASLKKYSSINFDSLTNLTNLQELHLGFNCRITKIPAQITNMTSLRKIGIYTKRVEFELDSTILKLVELEELWLPIELNDESILIIEQMKSLKKLSVASIKLTDPQSIRKLDFIKNVIVIN